MELFLILLGIVLLGTVAYGTVRLSDRWSRPEDVQDLGPLPVVDALGISEDIAAVDEHGTPLGHRVRSVAYSSRVFVVPIMSKPYVTKAGDAAPIMCPTCHVLHPVKCVHLWLDASGVCIVSAGVLEELKSAGLADFHLVYEGPVIKPPPLKAGHGVSRAEVDQENRKIIQYKVV